MMSSVWYWCLTSVLSSSHQGSVSAPLPILNGAFVHVVAGREVLDGLAVAQHIFLSPWDSIPSGNLTSESLEMLLPAWWLGRRHHLWYGALEGLEVPQRLTSEMSITACGVASCEC